MFPDTVGPFVEIDSSLQNREIATSPFEVFGRAQDVEVSEFNVISGLKAVRCMIDGVPTTWATLTPASEGHHNWRVTVDVPAGKKHKDRLTIVAVGFDHAGNAGKSQPATVILQDTSRPSITLDPLPPEIGTADITVSGTASDPQTPSAAV